jgi:hypothetical protein
MTLIYIKIKNDWKKKEDIKLANGTDTLVSVDLLIKKE